MKKIAIVSPLASFDPAYSIAVVMMNQVRMLKKFSDLNVEFWVLENCQNNYPEDLTTSIVKCLPTYFWENGKVDDSIVPIIRNVFQQGINNGIDAFICHDLILQDAYLSYNEAIRQISEINPWTKWFHFNHSRQHSIHANFNSRNEWLTHTVPKNSTMVFLNYLDQNHNANCYRNTLISDTKVVYNPIELPNLADISDPLANKISKTFNFTKASVRIILPVSSTRMGAKQIDIIFEILSILKEKGETVKFIIANAHCNNSQEKNNIQKIITKFTNQPYALNTHDILFTSMFDIPKYELAIPHSTVIDLFKLSNLFIFPTISECCPLSLIEAASTNNLIVSNIDFPALIEITGSQGALFFKFGSIMANVRYGNGTYEDRKKYFKWCAENIISNLYTGFYQTNAMQHIQNNFTLKAVWYKQMRHLLSM